MNLAPGWEHTRHRKHPMQTGNVELSFEPVFPEPNISVASATPFLSDLIRTLRSLTSPAGNIFNDICSMLGTTPFHVAWSKSMVEVHDP
ncbi:hypothetical protein B0H10DRAFT_2215667 [Mycena sp. CBHHK59/15]|nr:hypothetical protein B0H10DRAFT_2215667 [Mycena sp. CBHHK59/15]